MSDLAEGNSHQVTGEAPAVVGAVTVPLEDAATALLRAAYDPISFPANWPTSLDQLSPYARNRLLGVTRAAVRLVLGGSEAGDLHDAAWHALRNAGHLTSVRAKLSLHDIRQLVDCIVGAARVTADVPSTLGAGGSLEDDLNSTSELSRLAGVEGFTPGPWTLSKGADATFDHSIDINIGDWGPLSVSDDPLSEANAKLIAAAPTMYAELSRLREALEEILALGEDTPGALSDTEQAIEAHHIAREALRPALENTP